MPRLETHHLAWTMLVVAAIGGGTLLGNRAAQPRPRFQLTSRPDDVNEPPPKQRLPTSEPNLVDAERQKDVDERAGFLEVQDIFVSDMNDYRKGFRGPGKLDGSLVTWVNGALLRAVGARAGYDVHFAPFPYRPGTHTTVLYTTQRD